MQGVAPNNKERPIYAIIRYVAGLDLGLVPEKSQDPWLEAATRTSVMHISVPSLRIRHTSFVAFGMSLCASMDASMDGRRIGEQITFELTTLSRTLALRSNSDPSYLYLCNSYAQKRSMQYHVDLPTIL
jgi:hypothetical protein